MEYFIFKCQLRIKHFTFLDIFLVILVNTYKALKRKEIERNVKAICIV